ncbi:MAG: hypothetical protein PHO41_09850 [Eubacteriales bacterium]|nr:hypothetical protein [Eubacteriales bacterium]
MNAKDAITREQRMALCRKLGTLPRRQRCLAVVYAMGLRAGYRLARFTCRDSATGKEKNHAC